MDVEEAETRPFAELAFAKGRRGAGPSKRVLGLARGGPEVSLLVCIVFENIFDNDNDG